MQRREFLRVLLSVLGLTAAGSFVYPMVKFLAPTAGSAEAKQVSLKKSEIPLGDAKEIVFSGTPVLVINRPDRGLIVLSRVCTHLGCLVDYNKAINKIVCPCHGAQFDLQGNVISGPPPKPLPIIPVKAEGDSIVIG